MLMGQTGEVGTGWVIQEVWVVGGRGVGGWVGVLMMMCQTGGLGQGRVSQETWVVGDGVWGGMLMCLTGGVGTGWVMKEVGGRGEGGADDDGSDWWGGHRVGDERDLGGVWPGGGLGC